MENQDQKLMEKIISLCKRRGFVYQGSEVYGGLAGTFDYGPLGVMLKNNIKDGWRKKFVSSRNDMYEVDAAILMHPGVWQASGHVDTFTDPMVECKECSNRVRVDNVIDIELYKKALKVIKDPAFIKIINDSVKKKFEIDLDFELLKEAVNRVGEFEKYTGKLVQEILNKNSPCSKCKSLNWGLPRLFNMMFATQIGAVEDSAATVYLRPETAQGIFVNFKNIVDSFHPKLPFGIGQIGKAFRNEITPRDFIFRVREIEQMEIEYFVRPDDWEKYFTFFKEEMIEWMDSIGIDMTKVHELEVSQGDLAHYSSRTVDFEFDFPFGRKELYGLAYRTDFDLKIHNLSYQDEETAQKFIPHVIEPSFGVDRTVLALLTSAYMEDDKDGEVRSYLKFAPHIAPVICAVSPLLKNKPELIEKARMVYGTLKSEFGRVMWDDNGNIGKRYRRQDEIGTPWCIVIDFDTLADDTVTIRDRDTGTQERLPILELVEHIKEKLG